MGRLHVYFSSYLITMAAIVCSSPESIHRNDILACSSADDLRHQDMCMRLCSLLVLFTVYWVCVSHLRLVPGVSQCLPLPEVPASVGPGAAGGLCPGVSLRVLVAFLALHQECVWLLQVPGTGEWHPLVEGVNDSFDLKAQRVSEILPLTLETPQTLNINIFHLLWWSASHPSPCVGRGFRLAIFLSFTVVTVTDESSHGDVRSCNVLARNYKVDPDWSCPCMTSGHHGYRRKVKEHIVGVSNMLDFCQGVTGHPTS